MHFPRLFHAPTPCLSEPALFTKTSTATTDTKIRTQCGILSSRQDHTKGARPRKRGGDAPDGRRARRSVGQHTVSSMPPSLAAPRSRLAWRLGGFVTNSCEYCGLPEDGIGDRAIARRPKPALFMSASAAIADPLLRRAFGQRARPSDPHRTVGDWRPSFWRLSLSEEQRDRHRRRRRSQSPGLRAPVSRRGSAISRRTVMDNAG